MKDFEDRIGYRFRDRALLQQALTHSSWSNEAGLSHRDCNERLEYLGDAVLELASSETLYRALPDEDEGALTKLRAALVCEPALADAARTLALGDVLLVGHGELRTGGKERASILSDALEAVIGAIYLDGGFTSAKEFVDRFIMNDFEEKKLFFDSKTVIQELVQAAGLGPIEYEIIDVTGPDHDKRFTARLTVGGEPVGTGEGHTKKAAEQQAAYRAIPAIRQRSGA